SGGAQAAGIDVGYPLLDDDLVDFSLRLPPDLKLRGLKLRYFFKDALRDFLPAEIINKKKHGFGLPFGPWVVKHPALRTEVEDLLHSFAARKIVRQEFARNLVEFELGHHPAYFGEMVWLLAVLELWLSQKSAHLRG